MKCIMPFHRPLTSSASPRDPRWVSKSLFKPQPWRTHPSHDKLLYEQTSNRRGCPIPGSCQTLGPGTALDSACMSTCVKERGVCTYYKSEWLAENPWIDWALRMSFISVDSAGKYQFCLFEEQTGVPPTMFHWFFPVNSTYEQRC